MTSFPLRFCSAIGAALVFNGALLAAELPLITKARAFVGSEASLNAVNLANRRVELDNSVTFGGFHWNNPREIFAELRYRFHY